MGYNLIGMVSPFIVGDGLNRGLGVKRISKKILKEH